MRFTYSCALLAMAIALSACMESATDRRARFASDTQIKADAIKHVEDTYGLRLQPTDLEVSLNCVEAINRCVLAVTADASSIGFDRQFMVSPRYDKQGDQFQLRSIDDNLRTQLVQAPIQAYVEALLKKPDAPFVTVRVREYNDFVGIEPNLPTDLRTLSTLTGAELLQQYGAGIGLNVYAYVLVSPSDYEPRVRAAVARVLADPVLKQLGHGLDLRWYFRSERLPGPNGEGDADELIQNGPGKWLPDGGPDNTQAKWQLKIAGRAFGNDLDTPINELLTRLDKQEPMLTQ